MGYYDIELTIDYTADMGDLNVLIESALDSGNVDESIGLGDVEVLQNGSTGCGDVPTLEAPEASGLCSHSEELNSLENWGHEGCDDWTKKTCGGFDYWGGMG